MLLIPGIVVSAQKRGGNVKTTSAEVCKKNNDGSYTINTSTLSNARGYAGKTPLEVKIKKKKIVSVTPLPNQETPGFFQRLVQASFFTKWNGMTLKEVSNSKVDAVSGATFSSKAVIENVKAAAEYGQKQSLK